jgi:hypothetical protein
VREICRCADDDPPRVGINHSATCRGVRVGGHVRVGGEPLVCRQTWEGLHRVLQANPPVSPLPSSTTTSKATRRPDRRPETTGAVDPPSTQLRWHHAPCDAPPRPLSTRRPSPIAPHRPRAEPKSPRSARHGPPTTCAREVKSASKFLCAGPRVAQDDVEANRLA